MIGLSVSGAAGAHVIALAGNESLVATVKKVSSNILLLQLVKDSDADENPLAVHPVEDKPVREQRQDTYHEDFTSPGRGGSATYSATLLMAESSSKQRYSSTPI